ncbi:MULTISPECIES: hypothetical protein [Cryobacterium]|uniref:DUF3558 domain-containing protein n=1 Tax=Cryobacterium breve TaxID=1259258 RepID=A0ABY2IYP9_9MICO|nr:MULTISPECIES: hypothetical protein [Cryobacterium]TFC93366.1 hypothetical protein E3T20_10265 [Cryobacterium sp. TmT3-12]TFC95697.1 hypothetical protein E3O65_14480 [Cryobacterium breve]
MRRTVLLPALVVLASMALAGCASGTRAAQQPASDGPSATAAPEESASAPSVAPRGADTGLESIDAYALCKAQTLAIIAPDALSGISWAPFEDATWLPRGDGAIGIYIEATDETSAQGSDGRDVALTCKVGGTMGEPDWLDFGVGTREADRDTILDILARTDQA